MIFAKCSCGKDVGPHNAHNVIVNGAGLWFTHSREDCHSTGLIRIKTVEARAAEKAEGNPIKALEIEYYQKLLNDLKNQGGF